MDDARTTTGDAIRHMSVQHNLQTMADVAHGFVRIHRYVFPGGGYRIKVKRDVECEAPKAPRNELVSCARLSGRCAPVMSPLNPPVFAVVLVKILVQPMLFFLSIIVMSYGINI